VGETADEYHQKENIICGDIENLEKGKNLYEGANKKRRKVEEVKQAINLYGQLMARAYFQGLLKRATSRYEGKKGGKSIPIIKNRFYGYSAGEVIHRISVPLQGSCFSEGRGRYPKTINNLNKTKRK